MISVIWEMGPEPEMGIVSFKSVIPPGAASPPQLICISDIHLSTDKYKKSGQSARRYGVTVM